MVGGKAERVPDLPACRHRLWRTFCPGTRRQFLRHYFIFSYYWRYLSVFIFAFQVLKGVDDAIQKVYCVERFEIVCENYRQWILVLFQQYQTAPKLCVHQDDQVRRGWSAKTETENYTTICEVNSQFVLGEAIKHETNSNYLWCELQFSFLFFLTKDISWCLRPLLILNFLGEDFNVSLQTLGQFTEIVTWKYLRRVDLSIIPRTVR